MGTCAQSSILTGGGVGGGGVVSGSCASSYKFSEILDLATGCMRLPVCPSALIESADKTLSIQDVAASVKGKAGNVFSVWNQGLRVELMADVTTLTAVSTLLAQNKAKVVGSFVGDNDKGA